MKRFSSDRSGFTLIEILIAVALLAVLALAIAPKVSAFLRNDRSSFVIFTSIIARTFDDSYIHGRMNFLAIHLSQGDGIPHEKNEEFYQRENGISVVNIDGDGNITDSPNYVLKPRSFPSSFSIEEVLFSSGEKIKGGTVLIPYQPEGFSENAIIHIRTGNNELFSVIIHKFSKEPQVKPDYLDFESLNRGGNAF